MRKKYYMWLTCKLISAVRHFMWPNCRICFDAFIYYSDTQYTGFSIKIKTYQGSFLLPLRFTKRTEVVGTEMKTSGIESHNSSGPGERCNQRLRRVFDKTRHENPKIKGKLVQRNAIKACYDTLGPEGLVPSISVFEFIPGFPTAESTIPSQT